MKLVFLAENLQKKLPLLLHALSSRVQLPILSHILLETNGENLILSATDLEIGIEITIPSQVEEQGSITVPSKLFAELISSLPADKVVFQTIGTELEISGKKTEAKIQTTPKDEFPVLYEQEGEKTFTLSGKRLKEIFSKIVFSSSTETTRPALSGVLLKPTAEGMVIVATDGYRLSLDKIPTLSQTMNNQLIIPSRLLKETFSLGESEEVSFFLSEKNNQVLFVTEDTKVVGRLIEAEFPNFEKILPTDSATQVSVDRQELQKAVKTASIFAREAANVITLSLRKDKIVVSAKTPSLGENTVEVEAVLKGEENDIAFNGKYLQDVLANLDEDTLSFEMSGPLNPGVFRSPKNPSFLHLIMPIRTQG